MLGWKYSVDLAGPVPARMSDQKNICATLPSPLGAVGSDTMLKVEYAASDPLQPSLPLGPRSSLSNALLSKWRSVITANPLGSCEPDGSGFTPAIGGKMGVAGGVGATGVTGAVTGGATGSVSGGGVVAGG